MKPTYIFVVGYNCDVVRLKIERFECLLHQMQTQSEQVPLHVALENRYAKTARNQPWGLTLLFLKLEMSTQNSWLASVTSVAQSYRD